MQSELVALQPQLVKTVGEVEQLMVKISKEKSEVVEPKVSGGGAGGGRERGAGGGGRQQESGQHPFISGSVSGERKGRGREARVNLKAMARVDGCAVQIWGKGGLFRPSIPFAPLPSQAAIVKVDEANAQEKANAAKAIKDECESDLAEVGGQYGAFGGQV